MSQLQPWPVRVTHWANVVLLVIMAGSGLQILTAFPQFGPKGAPYAWFPQPGEVPSALTIGGWLAGGRAWHFGAAWIFVLNALVYLGWFFASGAWRERLFRPRRDAIHAIRTLRHDLRLGPAPASAGLYNGLQRLAYTGVVGLAALEVLTGLVLLMPVQLGFLTALVGGYDPARVAHFVLLVAISGFTVGHVVMVALHPRTLPAMLTGGRREGDGNG